MSDYDTPVVADDEVLADMIERFGVEYDTHTLVTYAAEQHGVFPPVEPAGYTAWTIALEFEPDAEDGRLYWLGPQPDHDD